MTEALKQGRDVTAYEYCSFQTINYISSQPLKLKERIGIVLAGLAYEVTQRGRTWGPGRKCRGPFVFYDFRSTKSKQLYLVPKVEQSSASNRQSISFPSCFNLS
jgi:hypothetical protein